ncbi:hypothetical protein [Facklamia miroungae]|uniref:Uncharacterized protein n=1 Tax=Facklamia miroungae TaxID=120956 RepID=A0A1G7QF31_9LACT|nr:hypothetical protein [Facklamia miroungae]NKZ28917.1 hypothetical protein [Facklamia miroungae]SDF97078.1 hypothetical protein SAMN05421791_10266 [Facklamia miroungae]
MKKIHISLLLLTVLTLNLLFPHDTFAQPEAEVKETHHMKVDGHHEGHHIKANFIPNKILNPDDSLYQAPDRIKQYVGFYKAQVEVPPLDLNLHIIVSIEENGLFNLAHYFSKRDGKESIRFYVNENETIESIPAPYQDLVILTGGLKDFEGGLGSGLVRKTLSPVVFLNNHGKPESLYPYQSMAYDLRENYQDARVYQNVGLYIINDEIVIDVNHLIGLDDEQENRIVLKATRFKNEDAFLVEQKTYEILQEAFDHYLDDYNDFKLQFKNSNDFVQVIQAMHLKTNASFPADTKFELIDPSLVNKDSKNENTFALLINDQILYFYDGEKLFVADEIENTNGSYSAHEWQTN